MDHHTTDDQERRRLYGIGLVLIGAAVFALVLGRAYPAPPQQPQFYRPDPIQQITIDNSTEVHVFSDWCVGYCP